MLSTRLPFQQAIESIVITKMDILLDIDRTVVAPNAAARPGNPPARVELELVVLGIAAVGSYRFRGRKEEEKDQGQSYRGNAS